MNWELICHVLGRFGVRTARRSGFHAASNLMLLAPDAEDWPGVVYVTAGAGCTGRFRFSLIVSAGPCGVEAENLIELSSGTLTAAFNALAEARHYLDTLDDVLARLDDEQGILDAAGMYLNTPFMYFDESYRILAITRDVVFPFDEEWRHMLEHRYLSPESALKMKENGDLDRLLEVREPIVYHSDIYPFSSVIVNIWCEDRFFSRLNMICVSGDTSPLAVRSCEIVAAHLERVIDRGENMPFGGPLQSMLIDLLSGEQLSEALICDRLQAGPFHSGACFQLFCIDIAVRHDEEIGAYYTFLLEKLCLHENAIALLFNGKLVILAYGANEAAFAPFIEKLSVFLVAQRLSCGVSNSFKGISPLEGYYGQALAALGSGSGERLIYYRDHMLPHMLSYIPAERLPFLISPDIVRLQETDAQYSLSLCETLKAYLHHNCNLTKTADRLFIHKNTLLYRLGRIRSIIRCDLDKADERLLLSLSFKLMERQHGS